MKEEMQASGLHACVEKVTVWILNVQQGSLCVMRQNWEVVIGGMPYQELSGPSSDSQQSQVASFLCHGLTPLHRLKSDRAN